MASTAKYIQTYADVPFSKMPFNEADNFALCQAFYVPIEKAADTRGGKTVLFSEVAKKAFAQRGNKHRPVGLILSKQMSMRMMEMAETARFGNILVTDCVDVFNTNPAVQFDAATFLLDDGTAVIVFRGTDDSVVGWKEDMDILVRGTIPSHQLAVDYLNRAASRYPERPLIVCGHSKGGNVALFAALHCKKETRDRIVTLYNNEGPGFADERHYDTDAYRELLPRYKHFVPQASFIGMMLVHDNDYDVIESTRLTGALQHDLTFWQVNDTTAVRRKGLTPQGKFYDKLFKKLLVLLPKERYEFYDSLANEMLEGIGALYLSDLAANAPAAIRNARETWQNMDEEKKETLKESLPDVGGVLSDTVKDLSEEAREDLRTFAEEARENIAGTVKTVAENRESIAGAVRSAAEETRENVRAIAEEARETIADTVKKSVAENRGNLAGAVRSAAEETRENVRAFAEETLDAVKAIAQETRGTIAGTVHSRGENGQNDTPRVAEDAAAKDEAETEAAPAPATV